MFNFLQNLTEKQKGTLWIITGFILLLHTLGIIETGLNYIIIFGSLFMIIYGFMLIDIHKKVLDLIKKEKKKEESKD